MSAFMDFEQGPVCRICTDSHLTLSQLQRLTLPKFR
jgi:hypothetical protein